MPYSWEDNHMSGEVLAMHHRLKVYPPTGSEPKERR